MKVEPYTDYILPIFQEVVQEICHLILKTLQAL